MEDQRESEFDWLDRCEKALIVTAVAAALGFGILALTMAAKNAWGHGAASWIMDDAATRYCCGPQDCNVIPAEIVVASGDGFDVLWNGKLWHFAREVTDKFSERKVWPSQRNGWWMCVRLGPEQTFETGTPRCLFEPPLG